MSPRIVLIALFASLLTQLAAAQQNQRPEYSVKEDQPRIGSNIRRDVVRPFVMPINLPYERLSTEDQDKFKRNYEKIEPNDEPPFPLGGLKSILDPIRKGQAKLLVDGELFLIAIISSSGEAIEVQAIGSPSPDMTRFAAQVLLLTKFKPAVCGGTPCRMEFPIRIAFRTE